MPRASRSAVLEPTPLGSLTQPASRSERRCDACGSDRVTELSMTLTDGTPVLFVSCRACEHRTWNAADGDSIVSTLPIAQVLDRARKIR
jgi:hypothetical protein